MLANFLKVSVRKLLRKKMYSLLNIAGLSLGITCFILLAMLVHYEFSFDSFHVNKENIYRIYSIDETLNDQVKSATTPDPLPKVLNNDFPEIDYVTGFSGRELTASVGTRKFDLRLISTDQNVFDVFSFPFLYGSKEHALIDPYSTVLSYPTAIRLFGNENPIGKTVRIQNNTEFVVTGVLKKIPSNSSIQFDLLVPVRFRQILDPEFENKWHSSGTHTYILCKDKNQIDRLENQLPALLNKYQPGWLDGRNRLAIEKLRDIHLNSQSRNEMTPVVSPLYLTLLSIIGIAILLTACFNYTNLTIASYSERFKEIGVRKIMGAARKNLISQFIGETILLALISTIIGMVLTELLMPNFNQLVQRQISSPFLGKPVFIVVMMGFGSFVGMLSGVYPAIYLSGISSVRLMKKHQITTPKRKTALSNVLLVSQFSIAATLIISMLIIFAQISYMRNYDLGFNSEDVIAFPTNYYEIEHPNEKIDSWMNHLRENGKNHGVLKVSVSEHIPGYYYSNAFGVMKAGAGHDDFEVMVVTSVDAEIESVFGIELQSGRYFSDEIEHDKTGAVLINETAARSFGFEDPVGKAIRFRHGEGPFTIIGVLKDIHFMSLQNEIKPVIYRHASAWKSQFIAAKINPSMREEALSFLEKANDQFGLRNNFNCFYVEDKYENSYHAEMRIMEIIGLFTLIAIVLSSMGLFGLTGISLAKRTKEIGIRKAHGASVSQILKLLFSSYMKPVILACIISWPVSYVLASNWLQNYPYRISADFHWMIAGTFLIALTALVVILYHVLNLAASNPINAIRDE
ncbi:MAG: ABC transporter permease [Cytophagales bacterium]|nr:ABC transporter permease [Cytophagales bacterium]